MSGSTRSRFLGVLFVLALASVAMLATALPAQAATIWDGPTVTFTKANGADWTLEVNQDRITDIVWITRKDTQQIFNIKIEAAACGWEGPSPLDTEWAYLDRNGNPNDPDLITASNYANLNFYNFDLIYNIPDVIDRPAVVHLISEDIYLNIMFTSWTTGHNDPRGGFSYVRSTEPASDLTWTGGTSEWSTNPVNNWKDPAGDPAPYADGKNVMFDNSNPGSATVTITNGNVAPSSVTFNNSAIGVATYTLTGIDANGITGDTGLTKKGSGTLIIESANTYTGTTTLSFGTINLGVAEDVDVSGPLGKQLADAAGTIILKGGTLQYSAANQFDYSGRFSTAAGQKYNVDTNDQDVTWAAALTSLGGSLAKTGTGTLTLSGANTYGGATTIGAGTLKLENSLALQNSTLNYAAAGGSINFAALTAATFGGLTGDANMVLENASAEPVALTVGQNDATTEYYGNLSGTGSLIKVGTGRLTLNTNDYDGNTTIREGILRTRTAESIGTGKIIFEGGTLQYRNHSTDISGRIEAIADGQMAKIDTNGMDVPFDTENGLTGLGGLSKLGAGTLALNTANDYQGGTLLNAGTLQVAAPGSLGSGNVTFLGGTLKYAPAYAGDRDLSAKIDSVAGGQVASIDTNGLDVEFGTAIGGEGGLTKLGDGALTLGATIPNGPTTVSGGALNIGSATGTVATLNVPTGGTANLGLNARVTQLNVIGGTVNTTDTGVTVNTATLSAGTVNASATNALAVTNTLTTGSGIKMAYTAGGSATSFTASGANVSDDSAARTLTLSGGVLNISSTVVKVTALPTGSTGGVRIWLDASNIDGLNNLTLTNGDSVATWVDKSGIGNNAAQTEAARQPTFVASSGLGGQPALRFDGGDDRLMLGDLSAQFPTAATFFAVIKPDNDEMYSAFGNRANDERWRGGDWNECTPGPFRTDRATYNPASNAPTEGVHIFAFESNSSEYHMAVDGLRSPNLGAQYNSGSGQDWRIGTRIDTDDNAVFRGDIAELVFFDSALSQEDINNVGGYLATKYGIDSTYDGGIVGINPVDLPNTAITVTSNSELALIAGDNKLGKLTVSGSSTVLTLSGATTVSFNGLAGDGTVLGTVIIPAGGTVSPGASIGTITVTGLTLDAGSFLTFEIADEDNLDQVIVTDEGGLTINGGAITLLENDTSNDFADVGIYNLISYNTSFVGDLSNLSVANTVQDRRYNFGAAGGFITLEIIETGFWNGGSGLNVNWSDSANWNLIPPQTGDVLVFRTAGGLSTTLNNDLDNGRSFASLKFDSGAPAFTLDGNSIILTGEGIGDKILMVNNSANIQTVNLDIALGTDGKIDAAAGDIVVGGNISGDYSLTKIGSSQLTLSGDNSHTGGTIINAGNVVLGSSTALGTGGNLTLGGGSLDLGTTSQTVGAVSVTAAAGSGDTIGNGGLIANSYAVSTGDDVVISADLGGASASLTKSGGGTLTLTGNNTYAGATNISAGSTLQVNGSLGSGTLVTVSTGATLGVGASGNIARDVAVSGGNMNLAGTLAAGTTLTISGGTVNSTGTGGTAAIVALPAKGGTAVLNAPVSQELSVTNQLTHDNGNVTITAGATPFKVAGSNVIDNIDNIILQGGTTTIAQLGVAPAGLDIRAWQGVDGQLEGTMFAMPGTPTHSTYAGTIGYATQAINMGGDDQEHFRTGGNSGVPDSSTLRPTGYQDNYTVEYRGKLKIEADGIYRFATTSDDGSALWIDQGDVSTANPLFSTAAVQNNAYQPMTTRNSGQISLTAGYHDFIVRYYEGTGGNGLQVQWDTTGGITWAAIPGANYFHGTPAPGAVNLPDTAVTVTNSSTLALPDGFGINKLGKLTLVDGSLLTLSPATSASFTGLAGNGTVLGTVIIPEGGMVSPGASTGLITTTGLTLDSGSFLTFEIASTSDLDQVIVTGADGLTINGGGIFLFEAGTTNKFSTTGVAYDLIGYNTSFVGDLANLYVENKIPDTSYRFEANGTFITLTLNERGYWNGGSGTDPNWSTTANWAGIAPITGDVLVFRAEGSVGVALNNDLDNGRSFASLQFDSAAPAFTLDGNSIKLTGEGSQRVIMVNNSGNTQTVNMAIELKANGKIDANSADIVVGGDISGNYSLTKIGGSQLTLSGNNSYTGGMIINAGAVVVGSPTALGASGGNLTMGGGSLNLGGTSQTVGALSVTAAAPSGDTISNGDITGTSYNISNPSGEAVISASLLVNGGIGLTKSGAGTATLSGTNTYTGLTNITEGTLKLGSAGALPIGNVTVDGKLDLNDNSPTIKALNGTGTITTSAGAATLTVGDGDASGTFSGKITDGMSATTVSTYELGASSSGTRMEVVNYPDNMGNLVPWIAKGTLPSGSILRSVSANLKIDASDADSWASDFLVYVDGTPEAPGTAALLQIGGDYSGTVGTVARTLGWNGGDNGPPNGAVIDTKTSGEWSGDIDLSTAQLSIGNNYAGATFSGTVSVTYGGTVFPVSLVKVGNGTLTLRGHMNTNSGEIAYSGETTIEAGTLFVDAAGTYEDPGYYDQDRPIPMNVTIESGATLMGSRSRFVGTLTMNGGKWNDENGFSGSWTGPVSLGAGTTSTMQGLQTVNGDISGPGGLNVEAPWWTAGELHLNGTNNTFEGGVTFRGGSIVTIVNSKGLGTGALRTGDSMYGWDPDRPWRINGGTLNVGAEMSIANPIDLSSGGNLTVTGSNAELSGQISGSGTLTKAGGNTLTLTKDSSSFGGLSVNEGALIVSGTGMTVGAANFSGGTTVDLTNPLTVNTSANIAGLGLSSDTPFILKGSDVVNPTYESHRTLTVQGGTMTIGGSVFDLSTTDIVVTTADTALSLSEPATLGNLTLKGGSLTADQDITMAADFIYQWELDSTAHSVAITGSLAFESTAWDLAIVDTGGTPLPGVKYDLFSYTGSVSGYTAPEIIALPAGWLKPSFTKDATHIYMMFGLLGDVNGDFVVDAADYIILKQNFGMTDAGWSDGDFNLNGTVDWDDLQLLMANFGTRSIGGAPAIPEPATLGLLAIGALAILRRRRRSCLRP